MGLSLVSYGKLTCTLELFVDVLLLFKSKQSLLDDIWEGFELH